MKIGIILESLKMNFREAVEKAASLNLDGVQIYANGNSVFPEMSILQIKEIKHMLSDNGLEVSALCGEFGCAMFYNPQDNRNTIEREKKVLELARQLGTNIVTTHIGSVPDDKNDPLYKNMQKTCMELARHAQSFDGYFAIETGPETAIALRGFLDDLDCKGIAVNFDPANLLMCAGEVPQVAVEVLKDYIVHTHAKDGIMLKNVGPKRIYAAQYFGLERVNNAECYKEVPLGTGSVDFEKYIKTLSEIGYDGYLTIEGCGEYAAESVKFLEEKLKILNIDRK